MKPRNVVLHACSNHPNIGPEKNQLKGSQAPFSIRLSPLFSTQPALLDHHPVKPFLDPCSLLISCPPPEPYPSLHHVFGMAYHLNSVPFLYLHHRHCQSQHIHLLCPSPPGLSLKIKMSSLQTLLS